MSQHEFAGETLYSPLASDPHLGDIIRMFNGKTVGVIGTGHIGLHVIRMAKGFEMNVIAYDKFANEKLAHRNGFKYVEFDYLLANSDIITLHLPDNKFTHHTINRNNIFKIKKGAYLINTARGGLIDPSALVWGLESGRVAGAGLDAAVTAEPDGTLPLRFLDSEGACPAREVLVSPI